MTALSLRASTSTSARQPATHPVRALGQLLATWRRRSRDRRELLALDARAIRDLGTTPQAIEFEASKPFWQA